MNASPPMEVTVAGTVKRFDERVVVEELRLVQPSKALKGISVIGPSITQLFKFVQPCIIVLGISLIELGNRRSDIEVLFLKAFCSTETTVYVLPE